MENKVYIYFSLLNVIISIDMLKSSLGGIHTDSKELFKIEEKLTNRIKIMKEDALIIYNNIYNDLYEGFSGYKNKSIHSMHAIIGSKNNTFVDSIRTQFLDPNDFIQQWVKGMLDQYGNKKYNRADGTEHKYIIIHLLKNEFFREYAFTFLERNFYRNLKPRTRYKPDDILWELWIGSGNFILGILMTPVFRAGKWTNDVSEIRRTTYKYWTIGHVMSTGIVDPEETEKIIFRTHEDLFTFYRSILKKLSNSSYEKDIFDRYIGYLKKSKDINEEPLLIPEIRYAGLEKKHKYRLDFTILNSHTQECIGFELSPSSSHMSVKGIKSGKTQTEMNAGLCENWNKEMDKRNSYYSDFGITTVTFTDDNLKNMDKVFSNIRSYLEKRSPNRTSLREEVDRLLEI